MKHTIVTRTRAGVKVFLADDATPYHGKRNTLVNPSFETVRHLHTDMWRISGGKLVKKATIPAPSIRTLIVASLILHALIHLL